MIQASNHVGVGFPPEEGRKLANALLADQSVNWSALEIDLSTLAPALLISAFFNGFLQEVHDHRPDLLDPARKTRWKLKFQFQKDSVDKWMANFKPSVAA